MSHCLKGHKSNIDSKDKYIHTCPFETMIWGALALSSFFQEQWLIDDLQAKTRQTETFYYYWMMKSFKMQSNHLPLKQFDHNVLLRLTLDDIHVVTEKNVAIVFNMIFLDIHFHWFRSLQS